MFFAKKVSVYAIVSYFCAISLGVAADTTVTSKQYVDNQINTRAAATNKVNGAPLSNENSVFYGTSSTAAATAQKAVSIPAITTLGVGTVIVVQPTYTSTVANSTIKLNDFAAYPMRYNNAAITTSTDSIVWHSDYPSVFVFDGTYWRFLSHGVDSNTTYSAMSVAEGQTGTATSSRVVRADYLKQIIQYWANQEDASDLHLPVPTAAGKLLRSVSAANDTFEWAEFTPDYVTSSMLNDYLTTTVAANTYQTKITSDNKLLSDLVDDTNQTHKFVTASEKSTWNAKQNAISDLATIRSGASAGATAVQPDDLADVATSGSYNDLTDKPTIPTDTNTTYTFAEGTTNGAFSVTPSGGSAQSVPVHGWADKEDVINKKNDIDAVWVAGLTSAQKAAYYPTVGAVHERLKNYALVNDLASKVDKVVAVAADKKKLISRNKDGLAGPAPSDDVDVADDGSFIVKHAVTADSATTAGSVPWTGVTGAPAIPTDTNTTYTFAEGTTNGAFSVTPSGGSAQSVPVHGWANKQDKITSISTSGTGSVVTAVTASNGTITATKGNVSYNDLTDTPTIPSAPGDIGAQPAGNYVTVAQGDTNANKAVITNASGNVTTGTIATDMIAANAVTSAKISDGTIVNADISSSAAIAQSKISGLTDALDAKMTTPTATATGQLLKATVSNGTTTWSAFTPSYASSSDLSAKWTKPSGSNKQMLQHNGTDWAVVTPDTTPTQNSTKPVESGGVYTALAGKASSSHNHPTSQVNALTGYSKGASSDALATSDTLNAALGKLENKADNAATTASGKWTKPSGGNKQMLQHNGTDWVAVTPDTTPTQNSTKPVESGGVYTALAGKASSSHNHDTVYQKKATANYKVSKSDGTWNDLGTTLDTAANGYNADNAVTAGTIASALAGKQPQTSGSTDYQLGTAAHGWVDMSAAQQNALNSGITSSKVSTYDGYATGKQDKITSISTSGNGNVVTAVTASNGTITATKGTTLGALATKDAIASGDITDGTIVDADISSSAAIAQSKISGLTDALDAKMTTPTATATGDLLKATVSNGTTTWSAFTPSYASSSHDHDERYVKTTQSTENGILTTNNTGVVGVSATISQDQVTDLVDDLNARLPKSSADVSFNYEGENEDTGYLLTEGTDVRNNLKSIARQVTTNKTNITGLTTNTVNGAPLSNAATYYYGSGAGAASSSAKTVEISSITAAPTAGMAIVVNPATTTTASSLTLNLNSTGAKTVYLDGSAVNTAAKAAKVWKAGVPSIFVYDGTYWRWVGNGANYQLASTSNYSMGNSSGGWTTLSTAQQNALNSGITSSKVTTYDGYATGKLDSTLTNQANKVLYTNSSGVVTPDSMKVPITDSSATGGWATMWID